MKTFELDEMGVQEMDAIEMKTIDGGVIGIDDVLIGLAFLVGFALGWWGVRAAIKE